MVKKHSLKVRKLGGEGIFDTIKSAVSKASPVVSQVAKEALPVALELGKAYAQKKIQDGGDILTDLAKKVIPMILSGGQLRKLKKGGAITINPSMISDTAEHALSLLPASAQKILKNIANNKGIRHVLKQGEEVISNLSGGAVVSEEALSKVKSVGSKFSGMGVKRGMGANVKLSPAYKSALKSSRGGSIYPAGRMGGSIYPAGMSGGAVQPQAEVIQLGSPYQSVNSPAMRPFIPNNNPFHYAPNVRRGGDLGSDILGGLQTAAKFAPLLSLL